MLKFGLIGEKLSHSLSPKLHNEIMKENGVEGSYEILEFSKDSFTEKFIALKQSDYRGVNITIPYKETVLPLLDEISPQAKYIGAVNTVLFQDGKAKGFNTDYEGFMAMLKHYQVETKGKEAVILGSGGASKAVVKALLDSGIYDITIVSRSKQNFHGNYTVSYEFFKEDSHQIDILVNCTPVGMYPNVDQTPIPKEYIRAETVIDLIYNPEKTLLLKYAEEMGCKTINGSIMLKEQAVKAQQIWNQQPVSLSS
ncbi:shikimate dehydrogenase [Sinanaerobacter chloroacetimidivorans]|jgi:shikimate dehydrogenase|uniref:Shikimate dehydrogenase (NADP(+)) n=1 Tax=Sinanaerobacter chloroacetimidivorans TaxID=2818044 RepID=A0A8J8B3U9_9FIRM|nr:shikimate dehydrogenase [Sinanaerobacter chloroacetimidivorans]MBR0600146.1 shikimate dehydrogenase [Sinanaerobacter chloroacetimidivorans]